MQPGAGACLGTALPWEGRCGVAQELLGDGLVLGHRSLIPAYALT